MLCYGYIYDMIFTAKFLKTYTIIHKLTVRRPTPTSILTPPPPSQIWGAPM